MSLDDVTGGGAAPLTPAMGAAYARAVHRVSLAADEANWFTSEILRSAEAAKRAATGVDLFEVRMGGFDELLKGRKSGE